MLFPHPSGTFADMFTIRMHSQKLLFFGFNFFSMFVPDLLHEFELRVWKAVFTHLMRLLYTAGGDAISKLNYRSFGLLLWGWLCLIIAPGTEVCPPLDVTPFDAFTIMPQL
jgi:hypothetical protein